MKKFTFWLKDRLWLAPAIYSIAAVALSIIFFYVDLLLVERFKEYIPSILLTKVELAKTIMGTLSGALLTMTTFTFSTILVVLTMYSSQFSPRTLKNFVHDKLTWRVLGVFLGGFIYNTLSLLFMRDDLYTHDVISTFIGILIAFSCLATFAYFIHHIASTVQVGKLIIELVDDAERAISDYKELQEEDEAHAAVWNPAGIKETITAEKSGYIQFFSFDKMINCSKEENVDIEICSQIGDYVYEGKPILTLFKKESEEISTEEFFLIGNERTTEQDLEFSIQKLVEVALRAISPGINDPNTANEIILRIGTLLGKIGYLKTEPQVMSDGEGKGRVLYCFPSYSSLLYEVYYQLVHYGKEDISVMSSIMESLEIAAQIAREERHGDLWKIQVYILESLEGQQLKSLDQEYLQEKMDGLAAIMNRRSLSLNAIEDD